MNESKFRNVDPVEIEVWVHVDTGMALLVSLTNDGAPHVWLPKQFVVVRCVGRAFKRTAYSAEIVVPEWLAKDRGLC